MLNQPVQGGQGGSSDCTQDVKNWWSSLPIVCKTIFFVTGGCYLFALLVNPSYLQNNLVNYPEQTFFSYHIWSLVTTAFIHRGFFDLLLCLWMIHSDCIRIERGIGSVHFLFELLLKNILIQALYLCFIVLAAVLISPAFLGIPSQGLFPTVMLMITLRGLATPEVERPFMCFPVVVKQKYYHWLLLLLIVLLNGVIMIDLLCAILVGYLEVKYFGGQIFRFAPQCLQSLEGKLCARFKHRADFVQQNGTIGMAALNSNENATSYNNRGQPTQAEVVRQNNNQFQPFQGRGVALTHGAATSASSYPAHQEIVISSQTDEKQTSLIENMRRAALQRLEQQQRDESQESTEPSQQQTASPLKQPLAAQPQQPPSSKQTKKSKDQVYSKLNDDENSVELI